MTDADRVQFVREVWTRAYLEGCDPLEALNTLEREAKARLVAERARDTLPAPPPGGKHLLQCDCDGCLNP